MAGLFMALAGLCVLGQLVCFVIVLIQLFKQNVGLGILGLLCSLFTFIWGWVKAAELQLKKVMVWWTILLVGTIVFQLLAVAFGAAQANA
jgi:hypothetical protein